MVFVSDFADQAVVLPVAAIVALVLGVMGWWRGLLAWTGTIAVTLALMLMLKLVPLALADDLEWGQVASPSGHVASACVVYGGLAVLLLRGSLPLPVLAIIPAGIAALMGYSRIELLAHNFVEVLTGAIVGSLGAIALAVLAGPRPRVVGWPVVGAGVCTMLLFHGLHLPAEEAIRSAFVSR